MDALAGFGAPSGQIQLDLGLSRGLHYYTGLIFEIHHSSNADESVQLCGGGRYDNLVSILGGANARPAAGFAFGVERLLSVLRGDADVLLKRPSVSVIPVQAGDIGACLKIAAALRENHVANRSADRWPQPPTRAQVR